MCEYCDDDKMVAAVCYIPDDNGNDPNVPIDHCPACGRPLTAPTPLTLEELYEETLCLIAGWAYGKEVVFKEADGLWYNRDTCAIQTTEEMIDWLKRYVEACFEDQ